jgi:hypothetical protein
MNYELQCLQNKQAQLNLSNKKVLMLLSEVYAEVANRERLVNENLTINLTANTFSYALPSYVLTPNYIRINNAAETLLDETGNDSLIDGERTGGLPTLWTIQLTNGNRVLLINTKPSNSYHVTNYPEQRLNVNYTRKIFVYSGIAENSFIDLDFEAPNYISASYPLATGFLTPTDWDNVIIYGALMKLIPSVSELYLNAYKMAKDGMPNLSYSTFKYNLAVPNETNRR